MAYELFANVPATTVASGGTDAPVSGTVETWTVTSSAEFPAAATGVSQFHVGDPAATSEMIAVTNVSGSTWTVTRGAESTTPVAHSAGFTVQQVVTAGALGSFAQAGFGDLGGSGDAPTVTSTHLAAALPFSQGGTGQETQQTALDALAGGVTSGDYLRGNGSHVTLSAIQAADVPVLNQNTSGTAAAVSGTVPITNGGTGQGTQQGAIDSLAGAVTAGTYLRGNGTHVSMAVIQAPDVPTLNQNTTGTASNITDTLDQVPAPAANVSLNSHKITSLADGAASTDAAAFGQIPASLPPSGSAGGDLGSTYPNPTVTSTHLASALPINQGGTGSTSRNFAGLLTPTAVKTSGYSAAAGDYVPCDTTSAGFTVTLPSAPADLTVIGVKMVIQGGTNTVTIAGSGSDVFNKTGGGTSLTLTLVNQGVLLQYKAAGAIWYVLADDLALSTLDSRYLQDANNLSDVASRQTALNNLAGAVTSGDYLRGNGANVQMAAIQAGDVPTLNQNTSGTAAALSATLVIGSGGTGQTSAAAAYNALSPMTTTGDIEYESAANTASRLAGNTTSTKNFLTSTGSGGNATAPAWGTISAADVPTLNQNTSGTAANVTGVVAVANGGSGTITAAAAYNVFSPMTTTGDIEYESAANTASRLAGNITTQQKFLGQTGNGTISAAPGWSVVPGMYLCSPHVYAPGTLVSVVASGTTLTAFDTTNITTNSFTAPSSTSVVVGASFLSVPSVTQFAAYALAPHGSVSPVVGNVIVDEISSGTNQVFHNLQFVVTGLTAGNSYQFDLLGANASGSITIKAIGQTSTTPTGAIGAPVTMTVTAV